MHANVGDWLVVEGHAVGGAVRRGLIEEVHGADGEPPFLVHWTDTGHRTLMFPGSDTYVLTADELRARETVAQARYSSMQHEPAPHAHADRPS